jgi:hypothetical protein
MKALVRMIGLTLYLHSDFTVLPASSGHIFSFRILAAIDSTSVRVSSGATAAKTNIPFPIDEMVSEFTVTEADATLCRTAR